jgi:hypothetical protein
MGLLEVVSVRTTLRVDRWDAEQVASARRRLEGPPGFEPDHRHFQLLRIKPYSTTVDEDCNLVTQQGWVALLGGIAGTTMTTKFSATQARIGAGTVNTAAAYADTKLGGDGSSSTAWYKLVSGAPTISTGSSPPTLVFVAAFGTSVANFAWAEFGTDNGSSDSNTVTVSNPCFLNHGISNQGTKASGQIWTVTETITFGYPTGAGTVS